MSRSRRTSWAKMVLRECSTESHPNIFVIGCLQSRNITVIQQQHRAVNIAWALCDQKLIKKDSRVAIIGAGSSGLTAAVCLASKIKCKVKVFESSDEILPLLNKSKNRWISPGAHEFLDIVPTEKSDLPFMNWSADLAHEVAFRLQTLYRFYAKEYAIKTALSTSVEKIECTGSKVRLRTRSRGKTQGHLFDVVLIAVGPGKENTDPDITPEFWPGGSIKNYVIKKSKRRRPKVLISGCGDSGLVDLFHLCIDDFRHERISNYSVGFNLNPHDLRFLQYQEQEIFDLRFSERDWAQERSASLYKKHVPLPDHIQYIKNLLRNEYDVFLNCEGPSPYTPEAMPINKLLLRHLDELKAFKFISGRMDSKVKKRKHGFEVVISGKRMIFDAVFKRWGIRPSLSGPLAPIFKSFDEHPDRSLLWHPPLKKSSGEDLEVHEDAAVGFNPDGACSFFWKGLDHAVGFVTWRHDVEKFSRRNELFDLSLSSANKKMKLAHGVGN